MFVQPTLYPCSDRCHGYREALQNFKITELIDTIKTLSTTSTRVEWVYLDEPDVEDLAVLVIQQLILTLQNQGMDQSLWILNDNRQTIADLPTFELKPFQSCTTLPEWFPKESPTPKLADGDVVRWIPFPQYADIQTGIVLGHFYAYARHLKTWTWKYLVWLKEPVGQVTTDTAWETDLEVWTGEVKS
ncbi:MAG: hypothetical protein NW224_30075 [Leptolyngbyaceae cyanobacterium bins.302]|nr:hypothetical protein [Leptolyngbyaceae cyanobacterium bins.302]